MISLLEFGRISSLVKIGHDINREVFSKEANEFFVLEELPIELPDTGIGEVNSTLNV